LARKPWLLLERHRRGLEQHFDIDTGVLLLGLQGWAQIAAGGLPTATGIANVSGNVYFACDLVIRKSASEAPMLQLSAVQALVANLFSHSEIGLDAIVSSDERPSAADAALIEELYTFPELRWLHSEWACEGVLELPFEEEADVKRRQPKEVVLTTSGRWEIKKRRSLGRYPKVEDVIARACASKGDRDIRASDRGDCMRHDGYVHQEVDGSNLDEWQLSFAQGAARKAYSAGGRTPLAGCAVRSSTGKLFAGSAIGTRSEVVSLTPLECAMVSLAANGSPPTDIESVVWVHCGDQSACEELRVKDAELLRRVTPRAELRYEDPIQ